MARLIRSENIIEEALLPCPFCGTTSKEYSLDGIHKYQIVILKKYTEEPDSFGIPEPIRTRYFATCTKCDSCGGSGYTGYNKLINHITSDEEAKEIAIHKWNCRIK